MAEVESATEKGFEGLGLDARLLRTLEGLGYEEPTPIQREAIPPILQGRDLVGQAATGTGKTAAFAVPLLQRLAEAGGERTQPSGLVLVPTRELAMQVAQAMHRYGKDLGTSVLPVYGGQPFTQQIRALKRGVDVIVATPGRAHDLLRRGVLMLSGIRSVVLDEADEMLDMGFAEDLEALLSATPTPRQTMLFSATMPARIAGIARRHLANPEHIRVEADVPEAGDLPLVRQTAYIVTRPYKLAALGRVLDVEAPTAALVFCRTRTEVDQLTEVMSSRGYRPEALHGGMSQEQRDRVMRQFRAGSVDLLIATDVAARGLDVEHLSHVVNFEVPCAAETYVHRIGRVGRAGRAGVAITLAEPREHRQLKHIERLTGQRMEIARVPTVADLKARRLDLTRAALREAALTEDLDGFRVVVEALSDEFDVMTIALAAVKMAHASCGKEDGGDEEEIPTPRTYEDRGPPAGNNRGRPRGRPRERSANMARLFVGAGRLAGIGPRDLVGAIAHEAGIPGSDIGEIQIAERFSIVEVPADQAEAVIESLRSARLKGRRVAVRRDRQDGE
ncbi:MAG: DEAD/DEAH box helicase [Gemmataceae bacterium]|nr:DEAD/DEAH box helicase [Gemmataceae bacterium]